MSHGERGDGACPRASNVVGDAARRTFCGHSDETRHFYVCSFTAEVVQHARWLAAACPNFSCANVAGCGGEWTMAAYKAAGSKKIREQVGDSP